MGSPSTVHAVLEGHATAGFLTGPVDRGPGRGCPTDSVRGRAHPTAQRVVTRHAQPPARGDRLTLLPGQRFARSPVIRRGALAAVTILR